VWTPDGTRIIYQSFKSATDSSGYSIAWKRADGTGDAQVLVHSTFPLRPGAWHPTMNVLAYVASVPGNDDDVMILPVEGNEVQGWNPTRSTALLNSPASERAPAFSPDGRWLSFSSEDSGRAQVYVQPFPGQGARAMVSNAGGENASWSRSRFELVFTAPASEYRRTLMVAPYRVENGRFRVDKPRQWAERGIALRSVRGDRTYALHRDGLRVAVAPPSDRETATRVHLTFVWNLFDHLRAIAPSHP
jgi:eukaryotic-like serine/threonine-protein kinase